MGMTIREAIESISSEEEKEHLRSLQVFAAQRYISLVSKGQRPHGPGKSTARLKARRTRNAMAKQSRRANRG